MGTTEQAIHLFNNYDSNRVLRMQNDRSEQQRPEYIKDLANKRRDSWSNNQLSKCEICFKTHSTKQCPILKYGHCEKCLASGIQRERIKHTTRQHKFDSNGNNSQYNQNKEKYQNNSTNFGAPPANLRKYNQKKDFNMMNEKEVEEENNKRNIVFNDKGFPILRIDVSTCIMEALLDSGCSFDGAIKEELVQKLELEKFLIEKHSTFHNADGSKTSINKMLQVPVRHKDHAVTMEIIVVKTLNHNFVLGIAGMTKLGINLIQSSDFTKN